MQYAPRKRRRKTLCIGLLQVVQQLIKRGPFQQAATTRNGEVMAHEQA